MSFPGTQSAKIEGATRDIAGDPRFRLFSTLPRGGWLFFIVALAVAGGAAIFIFVADGMLDRQERVDHAMGCAMTVYTSVNVDDRVVINAGGLTAAKACFKEMPVVDGDLDPIMTSLNGAAGKAAEAVAAENSAAEKDAVNAIRGHIASIVRWARAHDVDVALPELD